MQMDMSTNPMPPMPNRKFSNDFSRARACTCAQGGVHSESASSGRQNGTLEGCERARCENSCGVGVWLIDMPLFSLARWKNSRKAKLDVAAKTHLKTRPSLDSLVSLGKTRQAGPRRISDFLSQCVVERGVDDRVVAVEERRCEIAMLGAGHAQVAKAINNASGPARCTAAPLASTWKAKIRVPRTIMAMMMGFPCVCALSRVTKKQRYP